MKNLFWLELFREFEYNTEIYLRYFIASEKKNKLCSNETVTEI